MAYDLDGVNEDLVTGGTALTLSYPFTVSMWVNADTIGQPAQTIFQSFEATTAEYNEILWQPSGVGATPIRVRTKPAIGTIASASSGGTAATGTWYMATGVWASATDRRAFFQGTNKGTNATSRTASGTKGIIGSSNSASQFFNGRVAEVAVWDIALSDTEVGLLVPATGVAVVPWLIKPHNLVAYWSLHSGFLEELYSGAHLTANNTPTGTTHVPVYRLPRMYRARRLRKIFAVGSP